VIDHLIAGGPLPAVNLMGDHERLLLDALDGDRASATDWLWAGGREALASWGLPADLPREAWAAAFPAAHITWLRGLALTHREGGYFFVHAGVRPGIPLADQGRDDLLAIRQPFLSTERDLGAVIVHGHSSSPSVPIAVNQIGLDTGAGIGGKLTCAVLEDDVIGLLAA
jgi:serine/threonine protein phosphatase 1